MHVRALFEQAHKVVKTKIMGSSLMLHRRKDL